MENADIGGRDNRLPVSSAAASVLVPARLPAHVPEAGILDGFLAAVVTRADQPFLLFESYGRDDPARSESFSYGEFARAIAGALDLLRRHDVARGDSVLLALPNSPEALALYLASMVAGVRVVPVDTQATPSELAYLVGVVSPRLICARPALLPTFAGPPGGQQLLDVPPGEARSWSLAEPISRADLAPVPPETVDVVVFTSGTTTARPKGVMLTRRNMYLGPRGFVDEVGVAPGDRVLVVTPFHHVNALQFGIGATLLTGATLCLVDRFSTRRFWGTVGTWRPTVLWTMGGILSILMAAEESPAELAARGVVRTVFAAAVGPGYEEVRRRVADDVVDCYGMSEFAGGTCTRPGRNGADDSVAQSVGLPLPHLTMQVVDTFGQVVPRGTTGEIVAVVADGNVMAGYLDEPQLAASIMRDDLLRSGDRGFIGAEDGQLHFVGRAKDMVRRGGVNISAMEVENLLRSHPAVVDCAVVPRPDQVLGEVVHAFVVLHGSVAADEVETLARVPDAKRSLLMRVGPEELAAWCRAGLSAYKVPSGFTMVEELPRNATGKVLKRVLQQQFHDGRGATA